MAATSQQTAAPVARVVLFANVGNRDVMVGGRPLGKARPDGERLLAELAKRRDEVSLPLLGPTLDYLERAGTPPDRIILFATDQSEHVPPDHRDLDTVHFAAIARVLLEARLVSGKKPYASKVRVRAMRSENPSLYDETFAFYQKYFKSFPNSEDGAGVEEVFVLASGGTPAMNLGLLLAASEQFEGRCQPLYLEAGASQPRRLALVRQLQESTLRKVALSHVEKHQFAAAREVLVELGTGSESLALLADYATARLNFDWTGAWKIADHAIVTRDLDARRFWERLRIEADDLTQKTGDGSLFLGERFHRARVAWENGAYSEFLGLLVAVEEATMREVIRRELGLDYDADHEGARERRRNQIASRPILQAFVQGAPAGGGEPLDFGRSTTLIFRELIRFLATARGLGDATPASNPREFRAIMDRVYDGPARARNKAMHGDGGASRESIEGAYAAVGGAPGALIADLERAARLAGGRVDDWAVDDIRQRLITVLRE